ncbi:hypothetical protein ['Santalum album' aster yellows phytoplasma]|uniref:Uncharacterized protein n=1 Tax='Santalum album' aster yellows phytoplasma TaxID=2831467 RepID=A0ABS5LLE4_9MOLU|nr:hypothetical protein ['Santalum album' aster yellows phytoplasma]MBS2993806.1 hypothetical protein ['Santalum album' aster yellows phytoplasma]
MKNNNKKPIIMDKEGFLTKLKINLESYGDNYEGLGIRRIFEKLQYGLCGFTGITQRDFETMNFSITKEKFSEIQKEVFQKILKIVEQITTIRVSLMLVEDYMDKLFTEFDIQTLEEK